MDKWSAVGDLIAEILEINGKILEILKGESQKETNDNNKQSENEG